MNIRSWEELDRKTLVGCKIFKVLSAQRKSIYGKEGTFYLIDSYDWAGIIPVVETPEGRKFVMIRQFRHGTNTVSLEFPGGIVEPGEDPSLAIARELLEETGYQPEMIVPVGVLSPNPAFMTNHFHAFIAENCTLVKPQCLDQHEEIEVLLVPEKEAIDMVGGIDAGHALMTASLFFYMRYRGYSD
mgnify:CR=1 FL=1